MDEAIGNNVSNVESAMIQVVARVQESNAGPVCRVMVHYTTTMPRSR
jgi:hypothetical protein